jgi:hypothetical protein
MPEAVLIENVPERPAVDGETVQARIYMSVVPDQATYAQLGFLEAERTMALNRLLQDLILKKIPQNGFSGDARFFNINVSNGVLFTHQLLADTQRALNSYFNQLSKDPAKRKKLGLETTFALVLEEDPGKPGLYYYRDETDPKPYCNFQAAIIRADANGKALGKWSFDLKLETGQVLKAGIQIGIRHRMV